MRTANRLTRKKLARQFRTNPNRSLRVYGDTVTGFRLIDEQTNIIVGPIAGFAQQKKAIEYGRRKFNGMKARKIVKLAA